MTAYFKRLNDAGFRRYRKPFPDGLIPVIPSEHETNFSIIDWQSMTEEQRTLALSMFPETSHAQYASQFEKEGLRIQNRWLFPSLEIEAMVAL